MDFIGVGGRNIMFYELPLRKVVDIEGWWSDLKTKKKKKTWIIKKQRKIFLKSFLYMLIYMKSVFFFSPDD